MTKEFLEEMQELLHGESHEKKIKLKGNQNYWVQKETRINMFNIIQFMHVNDLKQGKRRNYYLEQIYSTLKLEHRVTRYSLLLLCMMEKNPVKVIAWQMFNKKFNNSPRKLLLFRLTAKL